MIALDTRDAITLLETNFEAFNITLLEESETWWLEMKELARDLPGIRGNEVFDARIAICLRFQGIKGIATRDGDFSKYSFLKIVSI